MPLRFEQAPGAGRLRSAVRAKRGAVPQKGSRRVNPSPTLTTPRLDRRGELGDFLRRRRNALTPQAAGLPETKRRRTAGLRREEVAELAEISTTLYTWLEQGRDVPVSERTIDAIATALELGLDERKHLHNLARPPRREELHETLSPKLRRLVSTLDAHPAFVLDHEWNIIFRNAAARYVFGGEGALELRVNLLEEVFTAPRFRTLFLDWKTTARALLEMFRIDFASYGGDDPPSGVVQTLLDQSPEFAALWEEHHVRSQFEDLEVLLHPHVGKLSLEASSYAVLESPGLRLLLFTPHDDETALRLTAMSARA